MSRAFAAMGWHVGIHYGRNKQAATVTLRLVLSAGSRGTLYQADIRDPKAVRQMVESWRIHADTPIAFVCNAGIAGGTLLIRHSEQTWHNIIATNLTGVFYCLRAVAPVLMAHGG
ncbi:MAG: SDR family NAD(P)-dependent oxidoreductase, partial [Nitrospira sp.]